MIDVRTMEIFVSVIDRSSFSSAAYIMRQTPSSISKAIRKLEDELGVKLINRSTHEFVLTEAGKLFYDRSRKILREVETARDAVLELAETLKGTLKIHVTPGTGRQIVIPALSEFLKEHHNLSAQVFVRPEIQDPLHIGVDLAIRTGEPDDEALNTMSVACRAIGDVRYAICASPEYLERHGRPRHPSNLSEHNCLIYSRHPSPTEWAFEEKGKSYTVTVGGTLVSDDWMVILDAALDGLGIARLLIPEKVDPRLDPRTGEKVFEVLFQDKTISNRVVWAVYPRTEHLPGKVKLFLEFLEKHLS